MSAARRDERQAREEWDVFDAEGRYLGPVSLPPELAGLSVHRVTAEHVYGTLRGELDETYVVRARIVRGGEGRP